MLMFLQSAERSYFFHISLHHVSAYVVRHQVISTSRIQALYYKGNTEARSRYLCCSGEAISITYSEKGVLAVVTQHAQRLRRILLLSMTCLTPQYFSTLSHKGHEFREKNVMDIKRVVANCYTNFV